MASKKPVPSRAALNALRGVILTTSCSVMLLAEERRRRLQIARAAIDNARKLHIVQKNRGPIALAESHGSWDGRLVEIDDDVLSMASLPRPRTSTRRRDRTKLIGTSQGNEVNQNDVARTKSISRAERPDRTAKSTDASNFLRSGLNMVTFDGMKMTSSKSSAQRNLEWTDPRNIVLPNVSSHALKLAVANSNAVEAEHDAALAKPSEYEASAGAVNAEIVASHEIANLYLQKSGHGGTVSRPYYDDVMPILERLLQDLESKNTDEIMRAEQVSLVKKILDRVASFGAPLPRAAKALRSQCLRFLQIISPFYPDEIAPALSSALSLSKDHLKLVGPLITSLQSSNHHKSLRQVLVFLSQSPAACSWARGMLVCRLLARHQKIHGDFSQTKKLFLGLQESGLFRGVDVPCETEYKIRRLMVIQALEAGEEGFANTELRKLESLDSAALQSDIRVKKYVIARKVNSDKLDDAVAEIEVLRQRSNPLCNEFQGLLSKVTDIVMKKGDKMDFEAFLRRAVIDFQLKLKHRWVYAVLDGYASRREVESVFAWLQFCASHGVLMDTSFNQRFFARCRKYWSFPDKTIQHLETRLLGDQQQPNKPMADSSQGQQVNHYKDSTDSLRLAVLEELKGQNPDIQRARSLIRTAHDEGCDVSEALTPLLMAQLERGESPGKLINDALHMGIRLHNSTYNKAAQALSAGGDHGAAAEMCKLAARENGKGQLLYNEYNFANLVFAYTGSASYKALQALLSGFTSEMQWWHGSRTCKESIKLAMKTTAMRTVAHVQDSEPHRRALDQLDHALLHVKKCRSTKEDRRAVSEAYVRLAAKTLRPRSSNKALQRPKIKSGDVGKRNGGPISGSEVDCSVLAPAREIA